MRFVSLLFGCVSSGIQLPQTLKPMRILASILLGLICCNAVALTFTGPATSPSSSFNLQWSGGGAYQRLRESINGGSYTIIANSVGGPGSVTYPINNKTNGTYRYWLEDFCTGGQQAPISCGHYYVTVTVSIGASVSSSSSSKSSSSRSSSSVSSQAQTSAVSNIPAGTGALPSFQLGKAELISPTQFQTDGWYATSSATTGVAGRGVTPELVDLADSLTLMSNYASNAPEFTGDYAKLAYAYVNSEIKPEFRFGLSKGALGAFIDKSGTPFDQAQLLKELLDAKNITSSYEIGEVNLTGAQFVDWAGIGTAKEACQLLANGGIPASVNGSSPADCNLSGAVSSVKLVHVWLDVPGVGKFDPSFKLIKYIAPQNLASYTGFNLTNFMNATTTTAAGSGVKPADVASQLKTQAQNFYTQVKNNHANAESIDVLGGSRIASKIIAVDATNLPYSATTKLTASKIPDKFRTQFSLKVMTEGMHRYTVNLFADETYGRYLAFEPINHPMHYDQGQCALKFDEQTLFTNYVLGRLEIIVNHPYHAKQPGSTQHGSYMDELAEFELNCQLPLAVVHGYGVSSHLQTERFMASKTDTRLTIETGSYQTYRETRLSMGRPTVGNVAYNYLAESSKVMELLGGVVQTTVERHHAIGLAGQSPKTQSAAEGNQILWQGLTLDIHNRVSASGRLATAPSQLALGRSLSWLSSAFEGGAAKRVTNGLEAYSTSERFSWGTDKNVIFHTLTPGSTVPTLQLMNFPQYDYIYLPGDQAQTVEQKLRTKVAEYLAQGYTVTLPAVVILGPGEMSWTYNPATCQWCNSTFTSQLGIQYGATFYAEKASTGEFAHIQVSQAGFSKGGGTGVEAPKLGGASLEAPKSDARQKIELGINKTTGDVSYTLPDVISVGSGSFPYKLSTNVSIKTSAREPEHTSANVSFKHAGDRWWRNGRMFEVSETGSANINSDITKLMGVRSPLEAAPAVASIVALLELNGQSNSKNPLLSALVTRWLDRQADDNNLRLTSARGSTEFVKHYDGSSMSFKPQQGSAERVSVSGSVIIEESEDPMARPSCPDDYCKVNRRKLVEYNMTRTLKDGATESFRVNDDPMGPGRWYPLETYRTAAGVSTTYDYDDYKNLKSLTNNLGRTIYFNNIYDNTHHKLEICDGNADCTSGRKVVLEETATGVKFTDLTGGVWLVGTTKTSAHANARSMLGWAVNSVYSPESTTNPMVRYAYNKTWQGVSVDLRSSASPNTYWDKAYQWGLMPGYANIEIDAANSKTREFYDDQGKTIYHKDPLGVQQLNLYDSWGRLTDQRIFPTNSSFKRIPNDSQWSALPDASTYSGAYVKRTGAAYDDKSNKTLEWLYPDAVNTDKPILETRRTYHALTNRIATETFRYAQGSTPVVAVTNTYDASTGVITKSTTSTGLVTDFSNYWMGLPRLITEGSVTAAIRKKVIAYDSYGNITSFSVQKPDGSNPITTIATYTDPVYGNLGDVVTLTDPRGKITNATYYADRKIKTTINPANITSTYFYSSSGNLEKITTTGSLGSTTQATAGYNPLGWMTWLKDNASDTQSFGYDARGFLRNTTDAVGRKTSYDYDRNGRLICQRDGVDTPLFRTYKHLGYNAVGQITSYNSADSDTNTDCSLDNTNKQTSVTYDAYGQLYRTTFPNEAPHGVTFEQLDYYPSGGIQTKTTRRGDIISYTYANGNADPKLVLSKTVAGGTAPGYTVNYSNYDVFGKPLTISQTGASTNTLTFTYDFADRGPSTASQKIGSGLTRTVSYLYDGTGNRTKLTWPDGYAIDFFFTDLNALDQVKNGAAVLANYDYDDLGRANKIIYGNGVITDLGYENDGDLDFINHAFVGGANNVRFDYDYNPAAQLTKSTLSNRSYHWRSPVTQGQGYATNKLNQYTNVGGVALAYDKAGNLTQGKNGNFTYDAENKLTQAVMSASGPQGALTANYQYDANGRRTQKSVTQNNTTSTTDYLSDGDHEIAEYLGNASSPNKRFIYGKSVDEIIAMQDVATNSYTYAHRNHQGSVISASNSAGQVTATNIYTYSAYGEPDTAAGTGAAGFPYRYTGRRIDPETGLYYYRARYYDAQLGRFMQVDPIGYDDQMNLYAYVNNDPYNKNDPDGKFGIIGAVIGGVIDGALEVATQIAETGEISDWGAVGGAAAEGALIGAATGGLGSAAKLLKNAGKIEKIAEKATKMADKTCCFVAGTLVKTESGYKPIESLVVGDLVYSKNTDTGDVALKPIIHLFKKLRPIQEVVIVNSENKKIIIETTDDHPFYVARDWKKAGDLIVGDMISLNGNEVANVESNIATDRIVTTYNFEVADYHTYYATEFEVLVHNCKLDGNKPSLPDKTIAQGNGVKVEHYYKSGDHAPAHAHVKGGGSETKIGPNGKPIAGSAELTKAQKAVIDANKSQIRTKLNKIGRWLKSNENE